MQASLLRSFTVVLALGSLALPAAATWSIVCVDTRTGEVAVGSATCLANFDLQEVLPVISVGRGAGAAQAAVDINAFNRRIMWDGFLADLTPAEIFADIEENGSGNIRSQQFGIVSFLGDPFSHTGRANGAAAFGVTGKVGTIKYAIQGNVLTGRAVVLAARDAFVGMQGDLSQRLVAGMMAARDLGGDGRCSCSAGDPTGCGSPPPSFEKSAHVGFLLVARIGDRLGRCNASRGCANGRYYLDRQVIGGNQDPDPVDTLVDRYVQWRANLSGRPDGVLSRVSAAAQSLPADGRMHMDYRLELVDVDGVPLGHGGAKIRASTEDPDVATVGEVRDHGDGTYTVRVVAGVVPGRTELSLSADDGVVEATIHPSPEVLVDPLQPLHCGFRCLSAASAAVVPLVVNEPSAAGEAYVVLGSLSGTEPGVRFRGLPVPLNRDAFFLLSSRAAGGPAFPGTVGLLDAEGHAEAAFVHSPMAHFQAAGLRVDWTCVLAYRGGRPPRGRPPTPHVTNVVGFDVVD